MNNIIIIGAGKGGAALLRIFCDDKEIKIIGIAEINPESPALELARQYNIPITNDFLSLLENKDIDAIFNVTGSKEVEKLLTERKPENCEVIGYEGSKLIIKLIDERKKNIQEIEEHVKKLEEINEKLKETDNIKTNFISMVSHELRTPLTSIKAFAEILLSNPDEDLETRKEFLTIINNESDRLSRLINDILDLSKIEAGKIEWKLKRIDLGVLVQQMLSSFQVLASEKRVRLEAEVFEDIPAVYADKDSLIQVLTNLLSNAIKFTFPQGRVRVEIKFTEKPICGVLVSVSDTGIGIKEEDIEVVFEKFSQISSDLMTDKPQGTGLGLAISMQIVTRYEGKIWVESEFGKGSTFYFVIPSGKPVKKVAKEEVVVKKKREEKLILVVDDEVNACKFLSYHLFMKGYQVIEAHNAEEAIEKTRTYLPDLITLDVIMPGIGGFDVVSILKNDPQTKDIPILIVSIIDGKDKGYCFGANAHINKPVDKSELIKKVAVLLDKKEKKKILIADDDQGIVKAIGYTLNQKGYQTIEAYNGEEALNKMISELPDLVILDIIMPKMNGYEVIQKMREKPETKNISIIVLTAYNIKEGKVRALSLGAVDYFTKTNELEYFYKEIEEILG
ncbi:response regulator [bacterium]|nr:response regulator [bacterium]MBU0900215.1 response regulator [bacterium]MBU1153713.1 response regulator [bacterium]MBU1782899.1 response regulator [bacterium]